MGELDGASAAIVPLICEAAGIKCELVLNSDYKDCVTDTSLGDGLKYGKFDACVSWTITDLRLMQGAQGGQFTDPALEDYSYFMYRQDNAKLTAFASSTWKDNMADFTVGVMHGYVTSQSCFDKLGLKYESIVEFTDRM